MSSFSPLRYPGGKAKIASLVSAIIRENGLHCQTYLEPFAGGAGVALHLLLNREVERIVINDVDKAVYSFWKAILEETNRFVEQIRTTPVTIQEWKKQREIYFSGKKYSFELGFAMFFLNRTNHSGILTGGPIGGYEQKGSWTLDCRFNRECLIEKILRIATFRKDIKVYNQDIFTFAGRYMRKYTDNAFVYFDPPYYHKSPRLYKNSFTHDDHVELCRLITEDVRIPWIATYDNTKEISDIYRNIASRNIDVFYSAGSNCIGKEILFYQPSLVIP